MSTSSALQKVVTESLRIDDVDKPAASSPAPAIETPVEPTTPAAPTPETMVEATAHEASEPLAVTSEVQVAPAPQEAAPEAIHDELKDAKAS